MRRSCRGGVGEALGQGGQDAVGGLDQGDRDVLLGVDPVEAVGDHGAGGAVQLGRELGAGGAGADDGDVELAGPHRLGLGVGAQAGVDQAAVEAGRLLGRVQGDGVLGHAGGAEIVAAAADGQHQDVVGDGALGRDQAALLVVGGAEENLPGLAVEADQLADAVVEMVPVRLGEIVQGVVVQVHAAGGDLVEQRLPQMGAGAVDQGDVGLAPPAQLVAQLRDQLQAAGAAAHDHDPRQGGGRRRDGGRHDGVGGGVQAADHRFPALERHLRRLRHAHPRTPRRPQGGRRRLPPAVTGTASARRPSPAAAGRRPCPRPPACPSRRPRWRRAPAPAACRPRRHSP